MRINPLVLPTILYCLALAGGAAQAQSTAFNFQGTLNDCGQPANGGYDLTFSLFNAETGPAQVGATQTNIDIGVTNGMFNAALDFGSSVFDGSDLWLEIAARTNWGDAFTVLSPRQKLTPAPYAITALNVTGAALAASSVLNTNGFAYAPTFGGGTVITNGLALDSLSVGQPMNGIFETVWAGDGGQTFNTTIAAADMNNPPNIVYRRGFNTDATGHAADPDYDVLSEEMEKYWFQDPINGHVAEWHRKHAGFDINNSFFEDRWESYQVHVDRTNAYYRQNYLSYSLNHLSYYPPPGSSGDPVFEFDFYPTYGVQNLRGGSYLNFQTTLDGLIMLGENTNGNQVHIMDWRPSTLTAVIPQNLSVNGTNSASRFVGDGSGLVNVPVRRPAIVTVSTDYAVATNDSTILLNGANQLVTLPDASTAPGAEFTVKLIAPATTATITNATGAQFIDGAPNYLIVALYQAVTVQSDGSQWWIIGQR